MNSHDRLKKKALDNPRVNAEYETLKPEFALLHSLLAAREQAGLTQAEVAERMGTHTPAIARLESPNNTHSPSINTLRKYADAVDCDLQIKLVPR